MKAKLDHVRAVVIGGSQSGKTSLAAGLSRGFWRHCGLRSIVFDPWREIDFGAHAWVTSDFAEWRRAVWGVKGCVAVWDEATTNGGGDEDNVDLFTAIRHNHPALVAIGHDYGSVLKRMRVNLTDLFLALSDADDARRWAGAMKDADVTKAADKNLMPQYAFLHKRNFQPVRIRRHTLADLERGILP